MREKQAGYNISDKTTVAEFLDTWYNVGRKRWRATTRRSYRDAIDHHITPHIGRVRLHVLSALHIDAMVNAIGPTTRMGQYARSVLSRALNQAVRWKKLPRNPVADTRPVSPHKRPIRILTLDEAKRLLEAFGDHPYLVVFQFLIGLGLRRGEVLGLRWCDLNWQAKTLAVTGIVVRVHKDEGGKHRQETTKTAAGHRILPLKRSPHGDPHRPPRRPGRAGLPGRRCLAQHRPT